MAPPGFDRLEKDLWQRASNDFLVTLPGVDQGAKCRRALVDPMRQRSILLVT